MSVSPQELPLLSVALFTYNSSEYVLDTLESVYRQSYQGPIELIISDDSSSDDTVDLCRAWMIKKGTRFQRMELLESPENTGISKNVNRGCRASSGKWIKILAGDDLLTDDCLEVLLKKSADIGSGCSFIMGPVYRFESMDQLCSKESLKPWFFIEPDIVIDLKYVFDHPFLCTLGASFFLSASMLKDIGYYDEIFRNFEDSPLVRKAITNGYVINTINEATVYYRVSEKSATQSILNELSVKQYILDMYRYYLQPKFSLWQRWDSFFQFIPIRTQILLRGRMVILIHGIRVCRFFFMFSSYEKIFKNLFRPIYLMKLIRKSI